MNRFRGRAALVASLFLVQATAAPADAQTSVCVSKQIGAAGAACASALKCYGTAAKKEVAVGAECLAGVQAKLSDKLTKLDGLECVVTGVATDVWDMIDDFALATALDELDYQNGGLCASKKLSAASKECKALFKCSSVAAKSDQAASATCLNEAGTKLGDAFTKAESKLTCTPAGNAGEVDTLVGDVHDEVVSLLRNGPTTTTTDTTSTTLARNHPPTIDSVSLTPSPAYETSILTCTPVGASDPDLDAIVFSYAWTVAGSPLVDSGSTLAGDKFAKGEAVTCTAVATDGIASSSPVTSNSVTISNTAPVATSSPSISPSLAYTNTNLTCTPPSSEDADGDVVTWSYEWLIDSSVVGASGSNLSNTYTSKGQSVECRVTPTDGTDSGAAVTSAGVTIQNTGPTGVDVNMLPDFPFSNQSVSMSILTPSTDIDGDTVSYSYYWQINGVPFAPYPSSSSTLDKTNYSKGASITCTVVPSDGTLDGSSDTDSVLVRNSAPTITGASISPATATPATPTLTCNAIGYSDYDNDPAVNKYQWWRNGVAVPSGAGGRNASIPGGTFSTGDTVYCVLTADDGDPDQDGNTATTAVLTIQ